MSLYSNCGYCHRLSSRADIRIRHEKHSCQRKEKPEDAPKVPFPTENQNGFPNGIEFGEAFWLKTTSSREGNLLLQTFPTCWQDIMDVYEKVTERPFGYMVLDLHPGSDDRKRVFSHLLTHEGRTGIREREKMSDHGAKWYIKNHFNQLDSFEARCLGRRSTREKRPWMIVQQMFLDPWMKTAMTA